MNQPQPVKDASQLYEVERRTEHAARPGFCIIELQLSATQKVPWHTHTNVSDTFYVLDGHMRLFLQQPKEEVNLRPGEVYVVRPTRPHLVTNGGAKSLIFLVLQGVGEYDLFRWCRVRPSFRDVEGMQRGFLLLRSMNINAEPPARAVADPPWRR